MEDNVPSTALSHIDLGYFSKLRYNMLCEKTKQLDVSNSWVEHEIEKVQDQGSSGNISSFSQSSMCLAPPHLPESPLRSQSPG